MRKSVFSIIELTMQRQSLNKMEIQWKLKDLTSPKVSLRYNERERFAAFCLINQHIGLQSQYNLILKNQITLIFPKKSRENARESFQFFDNELMTTDKRYAGKELSYGVQAKNQEVYKFLRDAVADNSIIIKIKLKRLMKLLLKNVKRLKPEDTHQ